MLTLDVLYAVLQGLPPYYLTHLDTSWEVFCRAIYDALHAGNDSVSALKIALGQASGHQIDAINRLLGSIELALAIPGLSRRQKEALLALRYSKVISLTQLSRTLQADPSNTQKRLNALIRKGLALKFSRKDGIYYYAISAPMGRDVKLQINQIIRETIARLPLQSPKWVSKFAKPTKPTKTTKA